MTSAAFAHAANLFTNRGQLAPDGLFVGRRAQTSELDGALCNGKNVQSVWLSGPRQIGKSSLAARVEFAQKTGGQRIDLSFGGTPWRGLDTLAAQIFERLEERGEPPVGGGHAFESLLRHAERRTAPLLVVIDEFDAAAMQLSKDEQAGLRKLTDKVAQFGWLFISRALPTQLCQDFGDDSSRLVSICHPIRIGFLTESDVGKMVRRAEEAAGVALLPELSRWIFERVGGYPVVDQALMQHVLRQADEHGSAPTVETLSEIEEHGFHKVRDDLKRLWFDLPLQAKRYVQSQRQLGVLDEETRGELLSLNLMQGPRPMVPHWLDRVTPRLHSEADISVGPIGWAEKLNAAQWACNDRAQERLGQPFFAHGEVRFYLYELARPTETAASFAALVDRLHRLVVEASAGDSRLHEHPEVERTFRRSAGWRLLCELYGAQMSGAGRRPMHSYEWQALPSWRLLGVIDAPRDADAFCLMQAKLLEHVALSVAGLADLLKTL